MGPTLSPETSVNNYDTTPRNIPEERRAYQHRRGSLESIFWVVQKIRISVFARVQLLLLVMQRYDSHDRLQGTVLIIFMLS
jgi:hypothetical protein